MYLPLDDLWYRGKIIRFLPNSKKFKFQYDDGESDKIDLSHKEFLIDEEWH